MESKKEIRQRIRRERANLDDARWIRDTERIAVAVIGHPWFVHESELYIYVDYNHEVGTRSIMAEAFRRGMNVWVPRVTGNTMLFCHIQGMEDLKPGAYGILEPTGKEIGDAGKGLMIMPGVAFDEKCHRVGYGKGFYDRYLEGHKALRRMAVGFEFQVFGEVPYEEHDICPEILVTEKRVIEGGIHMQTGLPKDPVMLLSVVNTKLRDVYHTLDELCEDMNVRREDITGKLKEIGYEYDEGRRQFV